MSGEGDSKARRVLGILGVALAIGLVITNANSIYGLLSTVLPIGTTGRVVTIDVDVYWESGCVNKVSSINWGELAPGDSEVVTVYVKNTGNVPMTLEMSTDEWLPLAAQMYIDLQWDYSGGQIQPDGVVQVTLTLTVSAIIDGIADFSFDIVITGTEVVS